jgi:hypothetical protein
VQQQQHKHAASVLGWGQGPHYHTLLPAPCASCSDATCTRIPTARVTSQHDTAQVDETRNQALEPDTTAARQACAHDDARSIQPPTTTHHQP